MKTEILANSQVKAFFTIKREDFNKALDESFTINNKKVTIKGFRAGKAPKAAYIKNYGVESLYSEALDIIVNNLISTELVKSEEFRIVGAPKLDLDFEKLGTEEDFEINLAFDVHPTVKLGKYKGIEVTAQPVEVTEEDITNEINNQLRSKAEVAPKKKQVIANGDIAIFDFCGTVDGVEFEGGKAENYELKIGSRQFIPGFEDQMVGMKAGDVKDITVTFPEVYMEPSLANKDAVFNVKLHEVKEEVFPELTVEIVEELKIENVKTVDEYKKHITAKLEESKKSAEQRRFEDELLKKVIDNSPFELPRTYVVNRAAEFIKNAEAQAKQYNVPLELLLQFQGTTIDQFRAQSEERAENDVKLDCILAEIVKAEKLSASDEEISAFIAEEAARYNSTKEVFEKQYGKEIFAYNLNVKNALELIKTNAKTAK